MAFILYTLSINNSQQIFVHPSATLDIRPLDTDTQDST
jgi:hypothetical protein